MSLQDLLHSSDPGDGVPDYLAGEEAHVSNDELDFDQFYATHFQNVALQLFAYFGDRSEAQDVTQEAFCRAWQRWSHISAYDDPVAWTRTVAWRLAAGDQPLASGQDRPRVFTTPSRRTRPRYQS